MAKSGRTVITRQEIIDPDTGEVTEARDETEREAELNASVSLFDFGEIEAHQVQKISISRTDPQEGHLGNLDHDATETTIKTRWGGGTFRIEAKNARGKVVKVRSVQIAGDPIFESDIAEARWRRLNGLKPKTSVDGAPLAPASGSDAAMSFKELMMLLEQKEEKRKAEADEREERRRREDGERQERLEKASREAHERQLQLLREDTERRERLAREDAERREKEHDRSLAREREMQAASAAQTQQFFTNMLAMTKQDGARNAAMDPVSVMKSTVEMVALLKDGNAEPQDAITALISRLPETLHEARETARAAVREIKGEDAGDDEGSGGGGGTNNDSITLNGEIATKVKALARHLAAQGKDPRIVLGNIATALMSPKGLRKLPSRAAGKPDRPAGVTRPAPSKPGLRKPSPVKLVPKPAGAAARRPPGRPVGSRNKPKKASA